jgi:hypothetical protein
VHVLRRMVEAVRPGGLVFDLQVIRPKPFIEVQDETICQINPAALFRSADAAVAAVDALIAAGRLVEEAVDDHDVRTHYADGAELLEDFAGKEDRFPIEMLPRLRALKGPVVRRDRCRLRRLRIMT